MNTPHDINDAERELIGVAVRRLRDDCNQTLNWLFPKPIQLAGGGGTGAGGLRTVEIAPEHMVAGEN